MKKDVAIIGGGASGLICAIFCAKANIAVDVFEQNSKVGKKLLVSGNGKCNITNKHISKSDYFSQNPDFVEFAIKTFGYVEFKKFAKSIGLLLYEKSDGKVYPISNEAKNVVEILSNYALELGVKFHLNKKIESIKPLMQEYKNIVIATGSKAAPHLGGCDDGEKFALELSHRVIPSYPSLVQLEIDSKILHNMAGVKLDAEITLFLNNKKVRDIRGDLLFTNYGLSGMAILDLSQEISLAILEFNDVMLSLNLLPDFTQKEISDHIINLTEKTPKQNIYSILLGLLPMKVASEILKTLKIDKNQYITNKKTANQIANKIHNMRFKVDDTHHFRHAEVSGGGVDTTQIDPKTYQSLRYENIYFCGEVLDVLGKRGGYNLAFAWASGYLVAQSIKNNI